MTWPETSAATRLSSSATTLPVKEIVGETWRVTKGAVTTRAGGGPGGSALDTAPGKAAINRQNINIKVLILREVKYI